MESFRVTTHKRPHGKWSAAVHGPDNLIRLVPGGNRGTHFESQDQALAYVRASGLAHPGEPGFTR